METRLDTNKFSEGLDIALSGGGFRATAFGLGVLLYLADSGLNQSVETISSVSGGSITNGFVASRCDFGSLTDTETFRRVAAQLAQIVSGRGKCHGFWLASRPYLAFMFVSGMIIMAWFLNIVVPLLAMFFWNVELRSVFPSEIELFFVVGLVWGVAALLRGELVLWWISRTFFHSEAITLGSLSEKRKIDHVFCATDLTSSGPFFFSTKGGGRIFSENYGRGEGKDVPLKMAVATSAAFPPLIPAIRFKTANRQFTRGESPPEFVYLSDGGVWNNLGTDWSRLRDKLLDAERAWVDRTEENPLASIETSIENCPAGAVLLIANASQPERRKNLWTLKVPVLSFLITLVRIINVTVNSTVQARSVDIEKTARLRMLNDPQRWELKDAPLATGYIAC
jgi:hypothetical protein